MQPKKKEKKSYFILVYILMNNHWFITKYTDNMNNTNIINDHKISVIVMCISALQEL